MYELALRSYSDTKLEASFRMWLKERTYLYRRWENSPAWKQRELRGLMDDCDNRILAAQGEAKRRGYELK